MPCLPGASAPIAITASKKKGGGKTGRGSGGGLKSTRGKGAGIPLEDGQAPQLSRSVAKRDEELYQIDMQRKQILLADSAEAWLASSLNLFAVSFGYPRSVSDQMLSQSLCLLLFRTRMLKNGRNILVSSCQPLRALTGFLNSGKLSRNDW